MTEINNMKTARKSVVVVGVGSIGRRHIRNLRQVGIEDISVVDPNTTARDAVTAEFDLKGYTTIEEALTLDPDIAVIATPTSYHVENAIAAAECSCHLLVEKPLSHKKEGIEALERLVNEKDLITLTGCNLRFHPSIRKIKELIENDAVGNVVAARIEGGSYLPDWFPNSNYRNKYSARQDLGGGVILDYIHEINYARWLFGEFETVSGMVGQRTHLDIETNDVASLQARTINETICELHLDYVQRPYSRSCHVIGEKGTIRWSWEEGVEWYTATDETWNSFECASEWEPNDMYLDELKHLLACIEDNCPTTCPVDCGRHDLAVALAARESAMTGHHITLSHQTE